MNKTLGRALLLLLALVPVHSFAVGTIPVIVYKDATGMAPANGTFFDTADPEGMGDEYVLRITQWPADGTFSFRIGMGNQETQRGICPDSDGEVMQIGKDQSYVASSIGNDYYWTVNASHSAYASLSIHVVATENAGLDERRVWIEGEPQAKVPVPLRYFCHTLVTTYSSAIAMDLPDGLKAYEAYSYSNDGTTASSDKHGTVYMRRLDYIPANTGVVLVGKYKQQIAEDGSAQELVSGRVYDDLYYLTPRDDAHAGDLTQAWTRRNEYNGDDWHNFLVPEISGNSHIGNATANNKGVIIYRHFGLSTFHRTKLGQEAGMGQDDEANYWGFFRFTARGSVAANKAWLRLPTPEQALEDCGGSQTLADKYGYLDYSGQILADDIEWTDATDESSGNAKAAMVFDDEERATTLLSLPSGHAPQQCLGANEDEAFYSILGVRLHAAPTIKGVYISQGRKYVIK